MGDQQMCDVEPVLDRVVMFWSDFRVPHEVLASKSDRYACTIWYFDKEERDRALVNGVTDTNDGAFVDVCLMLFSCVVCVVLFVLLNVGSLFLLSLSFLQEQRLERTMQPREKE